MPVNKVATTIACAAFVFSVSTYAAARRTSPAATTASTATPIRHLIVIFQENVSFDHYFATYPRALNPPGEPPFHALPNTPSVNGLTPYLLHHNPNRLADGKPANPHRLDRSQAFTCDQDHGYTAEQKAYNGGLMNRFVPYTSRDHCKPPHYSAPGLAMDYFDGNTVTALWNYAQHYAMSDNNYGTTFGPSTPGAMNLIAGQTHGMTPPNFKEYVAHGTLISDLDPAFDDCSEPHRQHLTMHGRNIGDLLDAADITWGWFQAGFRPDSRTANGKAVCSATTKNIAGVAIPTYIPHHEPFQFYRQTSNPHHLPPTSVGNIGHAGPANHQYGLKDFWAAADSGHLPAVSYLKASGAEDGHAGYSDPIDEQRFLVETINRLQKLPEWPHMAILITYDDSDGWYDHAMGPIVTQSDDPKHDALIGNSCGTNPEHVYPDRCGYGPRLPLLLISPWSRVNYVNHSITDQTSILRFIEDNWHLPRLGNESADAKAGTLDGLFDFGGQPHAAKLFLNPKTGEPAQ